VFSNIHISNNVLASGVTETLLSRIKMVQRFQLFVNFSGKGRCDLHFTLKIFNKDALDWSSYYDGEWKAGKKDGYGISSSMSGNKYQGFWNNDQRQVSLIFDKNNLFREKVPSQSLMEAITKELGFKINLPVTITKSCVGCRRNTPKEPPKYRISMGQLTLVAWKTL
jgi:hypothetical protein